MDACRWSIVLAVRKATRYPRNADVVALIALVTYSPREARRISEEQGRRYRTGPRSIATGLLESAGEGEDTGNTDGGEGEILQQGGGEEDQGRRGNCGVGCIGSETGHLVNLAAFKDVRLPGCIGSSTVKLLICIHTFNRATI